MSQTIDIIFQTVNRRNTSANCSGIILFPLISSESVSLDVEKLGVFSETWIFGAIVLSIRTLNQQRCMNSRSRLMFLWSLRIGPPVAKTFSRHPGFFKLYIVKGTEPKDKNYMNSNTLLLFWIRSLFFIENIETVNMGMLTVFVCLSLKDSMSRIV